MHGDQYLMCRDGKSKLMALETQQTRPVSRINATLKRIGMHPTRDQRGKRVPGRGIELRWKHSLR